MDGLALPWEGGVKMVTYEAMNMVFQFGIFLAATATAIVARIALFINRKK